MDTVRFVQLYDMVKVAIPGTSSIQLKEFLQAQDQERERWLDAADFMDVADWVVAIMRDQLKGEK